MVEEAVMEAAALGRPFQLGTLYDCRNDKIIPEFRVTTSDTIDDKISALKVDGSLKVSLLAGLVNVDGAAKYFRDTKKSNKQARLTLQYCSTTRYEELTMDHMALDKISHPNVFESDTATHVVTAVLYGADAYFVFDREVSSNESKEKIEGELSLTLSKLKFLNVSGEASLNMGDSEIETAEKFTCTFHGDFKLAANPSSFKEAMHVYTNLPNMLGENGEHAVPLRVWLYPLVKLDSRAARLQRDISTHLITDTVKTVEALSMAEIECNDLLREKSSQMPFCQNCRIT
ncbi:verrucotoxin subunit beta-like [Chanos chanos]|uniref:Verrucotoxin subunit beta-like n=1 Tax=Chanos chanos TaxID=29144 RepID=A0A6J2UU30_CHACN|nr:verrucotoxin subunit beta-like [Chanos chanos]